MTAVHPTALVDPRAELHESVRVGAFSIIGPHVRVGAGCDIGPHCVLEGHTTLGENNHVFQFASLGAAPQDKKYGGEPTRLEIGSGNTIREFVTINTGTVQDAGITRLDDDNWIMAYVHIAHDCQLGSHLILANAVQLAGHVHLGDWVFLGGLTGVHQFVRVGAHAFCGVGTVLLQDLPPYVTVSGNPAKPHGINSEGLKRRGYSSDDLRAIKRAYRLLYREGRSLEDARTAIAEAAGECAALGPLSDFIAVTNRGIVR